jgi:hypothetical protein
MKNNYMTGNIYLTNFYNISFNIFDLVHIYKVHKFI